LGEILDDHPVPVEQRAAYGNQAGAADGDHVPDRQDAEAESGVWSDHAALRLNPDSRQGSSDGGLDRWKGSGSGGQRDRGNEKSLLRSPRRLW
jgi:hypothetical protein